MVLDRYIYGKDQLDGIGYCWSTIADILYNMVYGEGLWSEITIISLKGNSKTLLFPTGIFEFYIILNNCIFCTTRLALHMYSIP